MQNPSVTADESVFAWAILCSFADHSRLGKICLFVLRYPPTDCTRMYWSAVRRLELVGSNAIPLALNG